MRQIVIAGAAGGLAVFFWGFLSWTVFHFSAPFTHQFANEDAVAAALAEGADGSGFYLLPGMAGPDGEMLTEKEWWERVERMPYAAVMLHPGGVTPNPGLMLPRGLVIEFLAALLIAWVVSRTGPSAAFGERLKIAVAMSLFAGLVGPMIAWNFMSFPRDWSMFLVLDTLVSWTICGAVVAALMKPASD